MNTATFVVSQTRSFPRSRRPAMTASMTESWTMTRDTGTMTRSPARTSRPDARDRIFSARDLIITIPAQRFGSRDDPLPQHGVELIHRQRTGVGHCFDALGDLAQLGLPEREAELLGAMPDGVVTRQPMSDVDRAL